MFCAIHGPGLALCYTFIYTKNMIQNKTEVIIFRITPKDKKELEKAVAKSNIRVSEFIRQAIKEKAESIKVET